MAEMLVCGTLAIVDAEIWIIAILMFAPYVDDTTIGKCCACGTKTSKAPYRSVRVCKRVFCVSKNHSSVPRTQPPWANLGKPKRVVHKRWIGCSACVGFSIGDILIASDLEQVACFFLTAALGRFSEVRFGGAHQIVVFYNGLVTPSVNGFDVQILACRLCLGGVLRCAPAWRLEASH